jgi:thioredoxin reductase (NADPH)
MNKPLILTVDDDPVVLKTVERDLRTRYSRDYRIVSINLGTAALDYLKKMQAQNENVALLLVDQRMPQMTGVEFLVQARPLFPAAKKVLLTAYADTEAAITAINLVRLDYYLMKPWDPPEENLYPILDDLLHEWRASMYPPGQRAHTTPLDAPS